MGITARLSKDRLAEQLSALAQIGAGAEDGATRLPYTEAEREAAFFVKDIMEAAGLSACFDAFGNLYGRLEGSDQSSPVVMSGSHIDTVINGGSYDGSVGVLAAIEALRAIREAEMPHKHPLVAAVFVSEEAARFGAGALGSRAVVGDLCRADLNRLKDRNDITLAQALMQWGYNPDKLVRKSYTGKFKTTVIGMIFIPSAGGISHAAGEFTHIDDIYRGAQVLTAVLAELANS